MNEVLKLNLPEEIVIKFENGGSGSSSITVDDTLSDTSTNPVQNKVVNAEFNTIKGNPNSTMGEMNLIGHQKAIEEAFSRTKQLAEELSKKPSQSDLDAKQDKTTILTIGSGGSIGLNNNHECRITTIADEINIILVADDGIPEDYQSYITFKTGDSTQINAIADTQLDYLIRFVGDDCNSDYEFTPTPNTSYEVGFKYVGEIVTEVNAGIPTYKHTFVARVGAF